MEFDLANQVDEALKREHVSPRVQGVIDGLLGSLGDYHLPTLDHSLAVGLLSWEIAKVAGSDTRVAIVGGLLHDIGKRDIPLEILDKKEGFDEEDMKSIREHPASGFYCLMSLGLPDPAMIALTHHTYKKKDPYPNLSNFPYASEMISDLSSRVAAIADFYIASFRANERQMNPRDTRKALTEMHPGQRDLIDRLYEKGILLESSGSGAGAVHEIANGAFV